MDGVEQAHSTRPWGKNTGNFIGLSLETVAEITLQRTDTTHDLSSESREAITTHWQMPIPIHQSYTLNSSLYLHALHCWGTTRAYTKHLTHFILSQTPVHTILSIDNIKITLLLAEFASIHPTTPSRYILLITKIELLISQFTPNKHTDSTNITHSCTTHANTQSPSIHADAHR